MKKKELMKRIIFLETQIKSLEYDMQKIFKTLKANIELESRKRVPTRYKDEIPFG